jgi:hypothetical protein
MSFSSFRVSVSIPGIKPELGMREKSARREGETKIGWWSSSTRETAVLRRPPPD